MRALLLSMLMVCPLPAAAQDHSAPQHDHAGDHGRTHTEGEAPRQMDHCAMGHLPADQCPPRPDEAVHEAGHHGDHESMDDAAITQDAMDHGTADKSAPGAAPESAVPARAFDGPRHAADSIWGEAAMAPSRRHLARENGGMKTGSVLIERLELRLATDDGEDGYLWDGQGWYGGDLNRLVLKSEGEGEIDGALEDAEIQALYSRALGPFFDLQAGFRLDWEPETRGHAVLGLQGLAPYMVHVDGALFLSDRGDVTARIEGEYDQRITQRLILQPRLEVELSAQDIGQRDLGAGLTRIEPGLRLRYEIAREVAPYLGLEYEAKIGETAGLARAEGEDPDGFKLLLGLRAWF